MTIPSTAVGAMSKSRPIVGRATFTIVMSMMFMNMADTKTADGDLLVDAFSLVDGHAGTQLSYRRLPPLSPVPHALWHVSWHGIGICLRFCPTTRSQSRAEWSRWPRVVAGSPRPPQGLWRPGKPRVVSVGARPLRRDPWRATDHSGTGSGRRQKEGRGRPARNRRAEDRSRDAPTRRSLTRLHGRGWAVRDDGLRPQPAVDTLPGGDIVDGAVVLAQGVIDGDESGRVQIIRPVDELREFGRRTR